MDKENVFRRLVIHYKDSTYNLMFLVINIRYYQTYIVIEYYVDKTTTATMILTMDNISKMNVFDMNRAEIDAHMEYFVK